MDDDLKYELQVDGRCILGEGIVWCRAGAAEEPRLYYVDLEACTIHSHDLSNAFARKSWVLPERIGWLLPHISGDGFVAGLRSGFARLWLEPELRLVWLHRVFEKTAELRLNDAASDRRGNIWAGSMNFVEDSRPDGVLFRLSADHDLSIVDDGYYVTNGPAIHPGRELMLHNDSATRSIYAFDLDENGLPTRKRLWKQLSALEGFPDGMTFDAEGCLWLAHWGGGCVSRFDADGRLLSRVELPATQVTNLTFAGTDLDRLFVTTARRGLSETELRKQPHAGGLFEILDHGKRGFAWQVDA